MRNPNMAVVWTLTVLAYFAVAIAEVMLAPGSAQATGNNDSWGAQEVAPRQPLPGPATVYSLPADGGAVQASVGVGSCLWAQCTADVNFAAIVAYGDGGFSATATGNDIKALSGVDTIAGCLRGRLNAISFHPSTADAGACSVSVVTP